MKKINQRIVEKAVESHYKKLQFANTFSKVVGVVGIGTFTALCMVANPHDAIIQAYAVGIIFSSLLLAFGVAAGQKPIVVSRVKSNDNINKF